MTTPPLEQPNRTIGSRTDHRAVAEVYGRVFAACMSSGVLATVAGDCAETAAKGFVALLRETA
jgi:hypothetical protein